MNRQRTFSFQPSRVTGLAILLLSLALAASEDPEDKTYAARLEAGAILEEAVQR